MKLNISLNPAKSRNAIPDLIAIKALFHGLESDLPTLFDKVGYLVCVILLYIVLSLVANAIAIIIDSSKSGFKKITGKSNEAEE